jgi:hypothetical protein
MKELTIHHLAAQGRRRARVRVSYRPEVGAQAQEREAAFAFTVTVMFQLCCFLETVVVVYRL